MSESPFSAKVQVSTNFLVDCLFSKWLMPNSCALGTTGTVMTIGLPIMDAHLKTVCQKKTRLTSPEVKALETLLKA